MIRAWVIWIEMVGEMALKEFMDFFPWGADDVQ